MFDRTYEPIGPDEHVSWLKQVAKVLQPLLVILGVFLAWGWWKGEAPGWLAVTNLAMLLSSLVVGAPERAEDRRHQPAPFDVDGKR